jgi:AraC-like DNA-binding protein
VSPATALPGERSHPPYRITILLKLLAEAGVPAQALLRGTALDPRALEDSSSRVTTGEWLRVCSNAVRLSRDPLLAFRAGAGVHLADLGMVGLLLQSCVTMAEHFQLAVRYQQLNSPALQVDAVESGSHVLWLILPPSVDPCIDPRVEPCEQGGADPRDDLRAGLPAELRAFLVEQQAAQQLTQVREALSGTCPPQLACFTHAARAPEALYRRSFGCPCVFNWHRNELRYPKEILQLRPRHAHAATAAMLQSNCDRLLADLDASRGFAGRVYEALQHLRDRGQRMQLVAAALKMTDRTLRRRLADEGTSFSEICRLVKFRLAAQRLQESDDTLEQIASVAGFSDSANFRRAFIAWTRMTPAQFRRAPPGAASLHPQGSPLALQGATHARAA